MTQLGDILYVRAGRMGLEYDGVQTIIFQIPDETCNYYKVRYQKPGCLEHGYWVLGKDDIEYYLEKR